MAEVKDKRLEDFQKLPKTEKEKDVWTEDNILKVAKKILKRMGIDGELQKM